jgi:hypothetical protein
VPQTVRGLTVNDAPNGPRCMLMTAGVYRQDPVEKVVDYREMQHRLLTTPQCHVVQDSYFGSSSADSCFADTLGSWERGVLQCCLFSTVANEANKAVSLRA